MLDYLTAELVNLGYEWNSDDTYLEDAAVVEDELVTRSGHIRWTDQVISGTEDDCDLRSSEDSDDSDDSDDSEVPDCEDCSDYSEYDSAESFEGYDNDDSTFGKYVYTSTAQISRAHSSNTAIQVAIQEINEFDMTSHQKLGLRGGWDKLKARCRWRQDRIRTNDASSSFWWDPTWHFFFLDYFAEVDGVREVGLNWFESV